MIGDNKNIIKLLMRFRYFILGGAICAIYGLGSSRFQTSELFLLMLGGLLTGFLFGLIYNWTKKMQISMDRGGYEYISKFKLFNLPLIHICTKSDEPRKQAKGIIAIGGNAMGIFSMGGLAIGIISIGGVSVGLISFGGLSLGLLVALGGLAVGFIAIGGVAVGQFVTGGLAYVLQLLSAF